MSEMIARNELCLGDVVECFEGPYGTGTVVKITNEYVRVFRVYVHVSDFSYTGGVMHYTGSETIDYPLDRSGTIPLREHMRMKVWRRGPFLW